MSAAVRSGRPEYYDFDLFNFADKSIDLDRKLSELTYTVFDTETTGLEPSKGDEIIQVGAARIVNNRLLRQEIFDQLVDPECPLKPESIPIHGITEDMVRGQPNIDLVLPAFHEFCEDTVLIAHNAAFDMRFLQLKEERTGIRFTQPVLDTLLLSAVIHPNQESHKLDVILERLGVRHRKPPQRAWRCTGDGRGIPQDGAAARGNGDRHGASGARSFREDLFRPGQVLTCPGLWKACCPAAGNWRLRMS